MENELTNDDIHAKKIQALLQQFGINDTDVNVLKAVLSNKPEPFKMDRWIMHDDIKVKLRIWFDKLFDLDRFVMTFVPKLKPNHAVINGVDTKSLEERMKDTDWYYANAESPEQVAQEYGKIEKIESEIDQLIKSPEGLRIATILWNNYVPFYTATKPELIKDYENNSDLYHTQRFERGIPFEQAYAGLKAKHELIDQTLKALSHYDPKDRLSLSTMAEAQSGLIANLENRMKNADWYFEYSDDHRVWQQGVVEIEGIRKDLELLSKLPQGREKADDLWGKYVPPLSVGKPDFLKDSATKETIFKSEASQNSPPKIKRPQFVKDKSVRKQKRNLKQK